MVAIPLLGDDVAPHFCSAEEFMLVEFIRDKVSHTRRVKMPQEFWLDRIRHLAKMGVNVLLCSGFNRAYVIGTNAYGMKVTSGLIGKADQIVEAFRTNNLERHRNIVPEKIEANTWKLRVGRRNRIKDLFR
jgi:predicted Fe-Mo cluster-binding NifX family protein